MSAVQRAVDKAGSLKRLADICGVRYQSVQQWVETERVPAERVIQIERALGIRREELRPDIYPVESESAP